MKKMIMTVVERRAAAAAAALLLTTALLVVVLAGVAQAGNPLAPHRGMADPHGSFRSLWV